MQYICVPEDIGLHPVTKSHSSLLQLQIPWHASPYAGWGHFIEQLGPMYPGLHSTGYNSDLTINVKSDFLFNPRF